MMAQRTKISGQILNRGQMAAYLACSTATLDRYVAAGCPVRTRGKTSQGHEFDSDAVMRWFRDRQSAASEPGAEGQGDQGKRRYSLAAAELKEIQLAEKRGSLVPIEAVTATLADELAAVRSRLLAMPGRLAGQLLMKSDPAEIEAAIAEEVRGALSELSAG
jgi:phage terminase Nu1 subunit (DNA packaging protein)